MDKIKKFLLNKRGHIFSKNGFTIIEIMIALTFLAITLLATANIIINLARNGALTRKKTSACNLCQAKIESLKSLGYDSVAGSEENNLDESGNPAGPFSRRAIVTAAGSITDTKVITVTVSWGDFFKNYRVSLRTLITRQ